jgi:hypothetical protein
MHTRTGVHVTERTYCPVAVGTTRYNSVRAHKHRDKSRACDVWGVLYVALEMLAGTARLPWHSTTSNTMLAQMKQDADHRVCAQSGYCAHTDVQQILGHFISSQALSVVNMRNLLINIGFAEKPPYATILTQVVGVAG